MSTVMKILVVVCFAIMSLIATVVVDERGLECFDEGLLSPLVRGWEYREGGPTELGGGLKISHLALAGRDDQGHKIILLVENGDGVVLGQLAHCPLTLGDLQSLGQGLDRWAGSHAELRRRLGYSPKP